MILEILDVEHGACALITTSNQRHILVDVGHNATTGWYPGTALARKGINVIDRLVITNYDEDHVSGYRNLRDSGIDVRVLVRNASVSAQVIQHLKTEDGMGRGIEALVWDIENVFTGGVPAPEDFGDTSFCFYRNIPGAPPFDEENNLSLVAFFTCGPHKIIFPGDMEKAGWRRLLQDPAFVKELAGVNLFVASHHGREDGYCKEVMDLCPNIGAVIISDKKTGYQSQETVNAYRSHAKGFMYDGTLRRVLTTRRDSSIRIEMTPTGPANVILGRAA